MRCFGVGGGAGSGDRRRCAVLGPFADAAGRAAAASRRRSCPSAAGCSRELCSCLMATGLPLASSRGLAAVWAVVRASGRSAPTVPAPRPWCHFAVTASEAVRRRERHVRPAVRSGELPPRLHPAGKLQRRRAFRRSGWRRVATATTATLRALTCELGDAWVATAGDDGKAWERWPAAILAGMVTEHEGTRTMAPDVALGCELRSACARRWSSLPVR